MSSDRAATLTPSPIRSAVGFDHDITEIDADAETDLLVGSHVDISIDQLALQLDGAPDSIDDGGELYQHSISGPFNHVTMMGRDGRINDVFSQHPEPGDSPFLVSICQPTIASHVRGQHRGKSAFDVLLEYDLSLCL